jgi:hypothetical protein
MLHRVCPDLRLMVAGIGLSLPSVAVRLAVENESTSPIREALGGRRLVGRSKSPFRALW